MSRQFSTRSAGVKRILREAKDIAEDDSITEFHAAPLEVSYLCLDTVFHVLTMVRRTSYLNGILLSRYLMQSLLVSPEDIER